MANVILPIMYYWLAVGKTINIRNYDLGESNTAIYNETDVVEYPVGCSFNASYYVLPDRNIPFEKAGVPIDSVLRTKYRSSDPRSLFKGYEILNAGDRDNAIVLVVASCKTSEQTMKDNANPIPNWQSKIPERDQRTHYMDKIVYGGQVVSILRVRSIVLSDVQVFRRILKDVLGTSGTVTANTAELWKKAEKEMRESPDVRGKGSVVIDQYTRIWSARRPQNFRNNSELLKYVSEFPDYVESYPPNYIRTPLYVSFKPLHDLDDKYPSLQKDVDGERYLKKLFRLMTDIDLAGIEYEFVDKLLSRENSLKFRDFEKNLYNVKNTLKNVTRNNISSYEDIDKAALSKAFEVYQKSLDNTTEDYLTLFRKLRETMNTTIACGEDFFTPTSGQLRVNENEVVKKGKVADFEECSQFCVEDTRCRAVGYSEKECLIYYRSTNSATIILPVGDLEDMKIYDRKCKFTNKY